LVEERRRRLTRYRLARDEEMMADLQKSYELHEQVRDERAAERLAAFLTALPPRYRHTFEFRHKSWLNDDVYALLAEHHIALCVPDRPDLPRDVRLVTDWTYLRLHGSDHEDGDYSRSELERWAGCIREFAHGGADVWAYFDNDQHGFAIANARWLRSLLAL